MVIGVVEFEVPDVLDEFLGIFYRNFPARFNVRRRAVSIHVAFLQSQRWEVRIELHGNRGHDTYSDKGALA